MTPLLGAGGLKLGIKRAFIRTSRPFLAALASLECKINVPIGFSTQKSSKLEVFSLVQFCCCTVYDICQLPGVQCLR